MSGRRTLLLLALAGFLPGPAAAAEPLYDTRAIPAGLIEDAHAVIRSEELTFIVDGPGKAKEKVQRVVTVLDADGRGYAGALIPYDRFSRIGRLEGSLLDARGRFIRHLRESEIQDYSAIQDFSLYEDNRVRAAGIDYRSYPYTVILEYDVIHDGLLGWSSWYPQLSRIPVEHAGYTLSVPADLGFRHRSRNLPVEPVVRTDGGRTTWRWEIAALPGLEPEPWSVGWSDVLPSLLVAPEDFEFGGHPGSLSSWSSFGKWYHELGAGRQVLPEAARREVERIAAGAASPREKIRLLYEHLQENTRYINVSLGIGGWQPYDAAYVFEKRYGDCKALTNYMQSMLEAVGITCHPALARAGEDQMEVPAEFPCQLFNHVMLCVPLEPDTIWLECTNQQNPFGHLGTFNEDRNVLVITPEGGLLRHTPADRSGDNLQALHATVRLDAIGRAQVQLRARYTGNEQDRVRGALAALRPADRESWLQRELGVPSLRLISSDMADVDRRGEEVAVSLQAEIMGAATRSGTRWFLRPSLLNHWDTVPVEVESRKTPVGVAYPFIETDSVSFVPAPGMTVEAAPNPVSLDTPFGSYRASIEVRPGAIQFVRRLEMSRKRFPPEDYPAFRAFLSDVVRADNAQVVLVSQ